MFERAAQPVELIDSDGIAFAQAGQETVQFQARFGGPGSLFLEDGLTPSLMQGIEL
jgi:hypothetical protein